MPTTTTAVRRIEANELRDVVTTALTIAGADDAEALVQAEALVEAELRGHPSHGIRRLPVLVGRVRRGLVRTPAAVRHDWVTRSSLLVHGDRGFGPVVARGAVDEIAHRASEDGVALAVIRDANHLGMLAPYVERLAAHGCVGVAMSTSEALVHPWGGARALVGTNPLGIAVPTSSEPLVLDMSTAAVSMGKVLDYAARAEQIPTGWAIDEFGNATTDAAAAARGALSPFGGPKGYALGIALEVLVGSLSATAIGTDVRGTLDIDHECSKGDVLLAVSLERHGLLGTLTQINEYLDEVRDSGSHGRRVDVPGDRARRLRAENLSLGVAIDPATWQTARGLATGARHD